MSVHKHKKIGEHTKVREYDEFIWCDFSLAPNVLKDIKNATLKNCYVKGLNIPPGRNIKTVNCYGANTVYEKGFVGKPLPSMNGPIVFWGCNLTRQAVEKIYGGHDAVFYNCNLTNCDLSESHIKPLSSNHKYEFCKHLHPNFEQLPDEPEDCPHVVEEITLEGDTDGQSPVIEKIYKYKDVRIV